MEKSQSTIDLIDRKIDDLRRAFARHILRVGLRRVVMLILVTVFLVVTIEGFRYFNSTVRSNIIFFLIAFSLIFICVPLMWYVQILRRKVTAYDDFHLADKIGANQPDIKDDLLNAIQLKENLHQDKSGYSIQLIEYSLDRIARKIAPRSFENIIPAEESRKALRWLLIAISGISLIVIISPSYFQNAAARLLHPRRQYSVQLPFTIKSMQASFGVLGGDSVEVDFKCEGKFPRHLTLSLQYPDYLREEIIAVDSSGVSTYRIDNLRYDLVYTAYYRNRSPFKPWRQISTSPDTIRVINRPEILSVKARFTYPEYTGLPGQIQEANITEFNVIPGTKIFLDIRINKKIRESHLRFAGGNILTLTTRGDRASGSLTAMNDEQFEIIVADDKEVTNLNPIKYRLRVIPDAYPSITLLSPKNDLDLTADMEILLGIRISDDFGFTRAAICYRLIKKYTEYQDKEAELVFPLEKHNLTLQELYYPWNIGNLGLGPEDAVEFRIEVYDSDNIGGPKKASTPRMIARFPSLNELFTAVDESQEEIYSGGEEVLKQLESTKKVLDEVARELLKKPELKWEQQKQVEEQVKNTREAAEKISKLGEQLDDLIEKSRENQLFNAETLEKLAQVQEAFRDIMTPEMGDALDKLQAALDKMDAKEVQKPSTILKHPRNNLRRNSIAC